MIGRGKSTVLLGALLLLPVVALATQPFTSVDAGKGANPVPGSVDNKLRLVKQLITQSPAVQRIAQSNNIQAKSKLADAQALYVKAQVEFELGRTSAAMQLADDSLRFIAEASGLVPDVAQQLVQERRKNVELREAIHSFLALPRSRSSQLKSTGVQTAVPKEVNQIDTQLSQVDALLASGNQHEANVVLSGIYKSVVQALNKMLADETIVYGLKFDTPADEFRHEMARNHSYEELIPIALVQLNVAPETAVTAERYVQQSRELRAFAQKRANSGDYPAAMKSIQDATGYLQRSLRVAGVVVPQSPEFTP